MNSKPHCDEWPSCEPREEDIRLRAYQLWLADGQVHGHELEHWFAARQLLMDETVKARPKHRRKPAARHVRRRAGLPVVAAARDRRPGVAASGTGQRVRARHPPRPGRLAAHGKTIPTRTPLLP